MVYETQPGTTLDIHAGSTDKRVNLHLPLVVPQGLQLTVANQTRSWDGVRTAMGMLTRAHGILNVSRECKHLPSHVIMIRVEN